MKTQELTELQKDALREIANIGACHAATALSQLVQKKIFIEVPQMLVVPFPDLTGIFDGPETMTVGMYTPIFGDVSGGILFLLPQEDALRIVDLLRGRSAGETKTLKEKDRELLKQTTNILVASYLSALTKFIGLTALASRSEISHDMLGAIVDAIMIETDLHSEEAVLVETELLETTNRVKGIMFFVPDAQSIDKIVQKIEAK